MPYENEKSSYNAPRRFADNERIKTLLANYQIKSPNRRRKSSPLIRVHKDGLGRSDWKPRYVIAIDGSFQAVDVEQGFPNAELAYLTIACAIQNVEQIRKLDENRPIPPPEYRKTQDLDALDWILPGCNVVGEEDLDARVSFRRALYEFFQSKSMLEGDDTVIGNRETLLDTYEALLEYKPIGVQSQHCPLVDECPLDNTSQNEYKPQSGIFKCRCKEKHDWYSTDALRIHERMMPYNGSNDRIYSEVMQVLERVWIVHILRTIRNQKWLSSLKHIAIFLDGPLAIFGQPAWISGAITEELKILNREIREITGADLLLLGIEKTGVFVTHFDQLDQIQEGGKGNFPNQTVALITDDYIKENIVISDSDKTYGTGTYFGRKFMYKTATGERIVATLPYLDDKHKDWDTADVSQFPRLLDALNLIDEFISSSYHNALTPIVIAHAEATLPSKIGSKVLAKLARDLTTKRSG